MNKAFNNFQWEDFPSINSPVNKDSLMRINNGLNEVDNRVITLDTTKASKTEVAPLIKEIEFNESNGIFTITRKNGSRFTIDTKLEKIAINFGYDPVTQKISLTLIDGTVQYIDLSALITQYEFMDTDTVSFFVDTNGKVSAIIKDGSITEDKLQPNYLAEIKVEAAKAESASKAADESKAAAASSASVAATKAGDAADSADSAAESAKIAEQKATEAGTSAENSENSAATAAGSATTAIKKAEEAAESAESSAGSANIATTKANSASASATAAASSATNADTYAKKSQSYAVGTGGEVRENDDTDCAEYYYEQTKRISQGISGVIPMGTISYEDLANTDNQNAGYLFNISDSFTSDDRFADGGGIFYGAGSNVLYTADGKWDVLAAVMVSGVKGSAETEYRQGFINITKANIGLGSVGNFKAVSTKANQGLSSAEKTNSRNNISALATDGDSKNNTVSFVSDDNADPTGWTDVAVIVSGEKHSSLWNKASTFFKNVRYLYKLIGNTQLSVGDGTITGAISETNKNLELLIKAKQIVPINDQLSYDNASITIEAANRVGNLAHIRGLLKNQVNAGISFLSFRSAERFSFIAMNYSALGNKDYQCFVYAILSEDGIFISGAELPYIYTEFDVSFFIK